MVRWWFLRLPEIVEQPCRRREARHLGSESAARLAAHCVTLQPGLPRHHLATATAALRETPVLTPVQCLGTVTPVPKL